MTIAAQPLQLFWLPDVTNVYHSVSHILHLCLYALQISLVLVSGSHQLHC